MGDWVYNRYVYNLDRSQAVVIYSVKLLNDVSFRLGDIEAVLEAAIDPYQAVRDGFIQYRALKLKR